MTSQPPPADPLAADRLAVHVPEALSELRFALPGGAHALFTDRSHGNLSLLSGPHHDRAHAARERLRESLSLDALVAGPQVHGTTVQRVTAESFDGLPADGRATSLRGVAMMVLAADCLPVILVADRAVAALHAGWRGLAAGVLEEGLAAVREMSVAGVEMSSAGVEMSSKTGARARVCARPRVPAHARARARGVACESLVALLGPCAGACCYEVAPDVHRLFPEAPPRPDSHLDLRAIARHRLLAAGVQRVEAADLCTICDRRFFSHRRQAAQAGRQAGIVWLP
ncbi:MAG TPA: polyphenol oxidase family protein [Solirubrobacteraceae bacterium]|nr:polyphenol oxidase family protein [Solirubrobacteraceae bacterium]